MQLLTNERCHAIQQAACVATCVERAYGFVFLCPARTRNDQATSRQRKNCVDKPIEPNQGTDIRDLHSLWFVPQRTLPVEIIQILGQDFQVQIHDGSKESILFFSNNLGKQFCLSEVRELNGLLQLGASRWRPWVAAVYLYPLFLCAVWQPDISICCRSLLRCCFRASAGLNSAFIGFSFEEKKNVKFISLLDPTHRCHGCSCERTLLGRGI